jgi:transcriptional regulator with XRE-family HTH domain
MDVHFALGSLLLRLRRELNMTQKQLEARAGVPQSEISRIERGNANPTIDTVEAIASALGATITLVPVEAGANSEREPIRARKAQKQAETVATSCHRLP